MKLSSRAIFGAAAAVLLASGAGATFGFHLMQARLLPDVPLADGSTTLPNGWRVGPAGTQVALPGDMPLTLLLTPDGKSLIVNNAGYHDHSISVIDVATAQRVQSVGLATAWAGMSLSPNGDALTLSSGGPLPAKGAKKAKKAGAAVPESDDDDREPLLSFRFEGGRLSAKPGIALARFADGKCFVSGIATGADGTLYFANIHNDTINKMTVADSAAAATSAATPAVSAPTGRAPYGVALSPDGKTLAVSNWAADSVSLFDTGTLHETAKIAVGSHPNQLVWGGDGRLFVANAGSNSVSILHDGKVIETVKTSLAPGDPVGSTPDALALSPDGKRLFVANADNNDIAVIDTANANESRVLGFIPTGWYPSALAVSRDGKKLFVGTAKGLSFRSNAPAKPNPTEATAAERQRFKHIGTYLTGNVALIDLPDAAGLAAYTRQVLANVPHPTAPATAAMDNDAFKKIKHVVYIIRENRTYDQVFGDMAAGNGDPNLCLFGADVTPNAHALAGNFVLLDNLYCNAEVSQDGHQWCDGAYATDYTEKAWPLGYSGRTMPPDDEMSQLPAGYLWDDCARHGVSYRTYGEQSKFTSKPDAPPVFAGPKTLDGHANYDYAEIPWFGGTRDLGRADIFIKDLHAAEQTGNWPQFMVMCLPEDHTEGVAAGKLSPFAHVGENDLALGKIADAVSHSRFWKDTAIFVIEDDAQNGPDHVDAHRTVGLVISPYVRHGVDSTMYSQASFVRTIELILGLPPLTQYDANATPLYHAFTPEPTLTAYAAVPSRVNLAERNPAKGAGAVASAKLDFSAPDRADPDALNAILWNALKPGQPVPAPTRSAAYTLAR